jgi:hypothetical protein
VEGGAARWRPNQSPPSPRGGIDPKIGRFVRNHQSPPCGRGPWRCQESARRCNRPQEDAKSRKKAPRGVMWPVFCGVREGQFPAYSSINGYNKKPSSQVRGGKPSSTLLQCQSLPTSFPRAVRSKYSENIVARLYISRGRGILGLSRHRFILQATSLQRTVVYKNKGGHNSTCGTASSLLFSRWKVLLHTVYIFNIFNVDWGYGSRPLSSLGRYVFGSEISYNKAPPRLPGLAC